MTGDELLGAAPPPPPPPIGAALERELVALAPAGLRRPARQLAWVGATSLAYATGLLFALSTRGDLSQLPRPWLVGAALAWLAGFVVPMALALLPARGQVLPRWRGAGTAALIVAVGFIVFGLLVHPSGPSSLSYGLARFHHGHVCLELGLATAVVPIVLGSIALRGALPIGARPTAAALGAAGGSLGGLVLHLHCPIADALHVGLIHGGVTVVAAALAAALAPRATAP